MFKAITKLFSSVDAEEQKSELPGIDWALELKEFEKMTPEQRHYYMLGFDLCSRYVDALRSVSSSELKKKVEEYRKHFKLEP